MSKLTDKQERFCLEYLKDLNATQSAIRAGYSEKTANEQGARLMSDPNILKRLSELKEERNKKLEADADYILKRLIEIDKLDISDILDELGNIKPVNKWSEAWKRSIQSLDIQVKTEDDINVYIKKIRLPDKLKNLELLGKHIDVSAFKDRLELTGKDGEALTINITPKNDSKEEIQRAIDTRNNLEALREKLAK